LLPKYML